MAQEGSEASVASTSTNPNWWDIHANPISSWNYSWQQPHPHQQANPNSSPCDEDISGASFTNASNQSGLSVGSSSATDLSTDQVAVADNHLWRQVLLSTGSGGGDMHKNHGDGENFLEVLSSKNLATDMFGPAACDYLKKLDESWEFTAPTAPAFTGLEKQLDGCNTKPISHERSAPNLSDLVSNWSIAPPQPQFDHHSATAAGLLEPNNFSHVKHEVAQSSPYSSPGYGISTGNIGFLPGNYGHEMKDLINFGGSSNCRIPKPCSIKQSDSAESKRPGDVSSAAARGHVKVGIGNTSEGKKKRSDQDNSETLMKKSKQETSNSTCAKFQAPKVKLGDKITTLQQIVAPFGKTDTASVLLEAIKYINFLHEQVQLLSDPFMKSGVNKELINPWGGGMEKQEKLEMKQDLSSRGLCLFPVSCTPQIYRENTGPDYWTPTYRGCLYRS